MLAMELGIAPNALLEADGEVFDEILELREERRRRERREALRARLRGGGR